MVKVNMNGFIAEMSVEEFKQLAEKRTYKKKVLTGIVKKYKRKRANQQWTLTETNLLGSIGGKKRSWDSVGRELKRTPNACYLKYYELKKTGSIKI